jgi:hypothetical protein
MSSIAVFLILGGATAFAAKKIGSNEIKGNSITTGKIKKEAVTKAKIKKAAIDSSKLADNSVTTAKIADDAVTGDKVKESTLGTVPDASKLGGLAPSAFQSRVRWALVDSSANGNQGQILAQSGGIAIAPGGTSGFSYLNWGESIASKALSVSIAQIAEGFITVTPCGSTAPAATGCAPAGTNDSNHTIVRMDASGGGADNQIYFISVTS